MRLHDLRGKQANINRWEALKMLDWEKDSEVIKKLFDVTNPLFFSKRTPQQAVEEIRNSIEFEKKMMEAEKEESK